MSYFYRVCCSFSLILIFSLLSVKSFAQVTINLAQAGENGFDLENLQATLKSITENDVKLITDDTNVFSNGFDLISLNASQASEACANNQLIRLKDTTEFKPLFKRRNFLRKNKNDCAVNFATYSMVIAYPLFNMVTSRPETPADLFDVEHFPGGRALPDGPIGTLEWALLAYGIPINEVYQLLSTERGMKLAFAKLQTIRRHIIWWKDVDELKQLIKNNQVSLAAGPHNVFFDLQFNHRWKYFGTGNWLSK